MIRKKLQAIAGANDNSIVEQDYSSSQHISFDSVSKPLILFKESYIKFHQELPSYVQFNTEKIDIGDSHAYCVILPLLAHDLISPEILKDGSVQYSEKEKELMKTFYQTETGKAYDQTKQSTKDTSASTSGKRKRNESDDDSN